MIDVAPRVMPGLSSRAAAERLASFGPNELPPPHRPGLGARAVRQLVEPMALLLLAAAAVTGFGLRKAPDALAIVAIVAANAVIALVQEGKAANALDALRTMETPVARVVRDGRVTTIASRDVVPGDVVVVAAGDRVPADVRLTETAGLEIDESMLTGESLPAAKDANAIEGDGLGDRTATAFSGTLVVRGSARGVVLETGARTQLGRIAERLREDEQQTPLQRELRRMTLRLGVVSAGVAAGVFGVTLARLGVGDRGFETAFLSAAALAVAAVPEGLPTVVTVALALGVRRMATHGSIVRRLPAVETLGSTTVILTDKTGTLTENRMRVDTMLAPDGAPASGDAATAIAAVLALCNDATLDPPTGDPMEIALLEALGADVVAELRASHPRLAATPFDSERKRMSTANAFDGGAELLVKGAPEVVVPLCPGAPAGVLERAARMAGKGSRVLALARRPIGAATDIAGYERDLELAGLVALRDGVRAEAAGAVADARGAGIHIVMVTGDHPGTAVAIAREVGLSSTNAVVTGAELRRTGLPDDLLRVPVYARVDPDEKLALAEALRERGHVVAVTGDGVNDAPALRRADIGVAMGRSGSDVAREAADMVVTDDNLATIVTAVREGRGVFDNIRKVVEYLVAGNMSEIMVVVAGLLFFPGLGVPLLPLQLLWINLLTDGFPALALGVDPVNPRLMERGPRRRDAQMLSGRRLVTLLTRAVLIAGAAIGSLAVARFVWHEPWPHARASMFSVLMTAHLLYAFALRRPPAGTRANRWLVAAVLGGIALQVVVVVLPALHALFGTAALSMREWVLVAVAGSLPALAIRRFTTRS